MPRGLQGAGDGLRHKKLVLGTGFLLANTQRLWYIPPLLALSGLEC